MFCQRFWQNITLKQGHTTVQELEPENVYVVVTWQYTDNILNLEKLFNSMIAVPPCARSRSMSGHGRDFVANLKRVDVVLVASTIGSLVFVESSQGYHLYI